MSFISEGITGVGSNVARSIASRLNPLRDIQGSSGEVRYGMEENPNYIVRVYADGIQVAKGYVPETFQLSVVSRYGQPFGQGVANQGAVGNAAKVLGHTTLTSQSMTMQVWEGSEPLELQFEFEFLAEKDAYKEVIEPVLKLLKLVMPSRTGVGGTLAPPGPQIQWGNTIADVAAATARGVAKNASDMASNPTIANMSGVGLVKQTASEIKGALETAVDGAKNKIQIYIGRFMKFDNVVIESVNQTWHSMFDDEGQPLRATVAITFKTFMIPTVEDLGKIFLHSPQTSEVSGRPRGGA